MFFLEMGFLEAAAKIFENEKEGYERIIVWYFLKLLNSF